MVKLPFEELASVSSLQGLPSQLCPPHSSATPRVFVQGFLTHDPHLRLQVSPKISTFGFECTLYACVILRCQNSKNQELMHNLIT